MAGYAVASPRRPLTALLLSVCPGMGQQYAGHLVRGILAYVGLIVFSWAAAVAYLYTPSRLLSVLLIGVPFAGVAVIAADAVRCAARQPEDYRLRWYNRWWIYLAVFLTLLFTVNPLLDRIVGSNVVRAHLVTTDSMYPSVYRYDLVVINKLVRPERGDIVLVSFDRTPGDSGVTELAQHTILRRIVAMPGDSLTIVGREVRVNGSRLQEPYASWDEGEGFNSYTSKGFSLHIERLPDGAYFVLSDARRFSFDSRMFGPVRREQIAGVATKVFWSWNFDGNQFKWNRLAIYL